MSKTEFCKDSLAAAVVRQMGGWQSFKESAEDITNHGIDGGFSGFIYYRETVAFAKRNRPAIVALLKEQASDFGEGGPIALVRGFNCLTDKRTSPAKPEYSEDEIGAALYGRATGDSADMILNALAWYAGEEVARRYCDAPENA